MHLPFRIKAGKRKRGADAVEEARNSRALGAGGTGAGKMQKYIRRRLYPCGLDMHDGTPETEVSELLLLRDYQSRRRRLRNALPS